MQWHSPKNIPSVKMLKIIKLLQNNSTRTPKIIKRNAVRIESNNPMTERMDTGQSKTLCRRVSGRCWQSLAVMRYIHFSSICSLWRKHLNCEHMKQITISVVYSYKAPITMLLYGKYCARFSSAYRSIDRYIFT